MQKSILFMKCATRWDHTLGREGAVLIQRNEPAAFAVSSSLVIPGRSRSGSLKAHFRSLHFSVRSKSSRVIFWISWTE